MKKTASRLLILFVFLSASSHLAQDVKQAFKLINKTGLEIHRLFITPSTSDEWGENILGKEIMKDGEEWIIKFPPKGNVHKWDLRLEDKDGKFLEWKEIDLYLFDKITLYYDGKQATATFNQKL